MAEDSRVLAEKLFAFNFQLAHWNSCYYNKEFNVNGRSGLSLTARQFGLLLMTDKMGVATVTQFEEILGLSKSSLSLTISKLEREGYLQKEQHKNAEDGRKVFFSLTEKGKAELDRVNQRMIQIFEAFYNSLNSRQKRDLKIGIEKLDGVFGGGFQNE